MSETFWMVLIVCTTVVLVVIFALPQLRSVLKVFKVKADKRGVNATLETKPDPNVMTDGNTVVGKDNRINVEAADVSVRENTVLGIGNEINVKTPQQRATKKTTKK